MLAIITALFVSISTAKAPQSILGDIEYAAEVCRAMGIRFYYDERYIQPFDLNKDGINDYIIDGRGMRCGLMTDNIYGGASGLPLYVYVSEGPDTWKKVLNIQAFEYRIQEKYGLAPFFDIWVRGDVGYKKNMMRHQWDGEKLSVVEIEYGAEIPQQLWKNLD